MKLIQVKKTNNFNEIKVKQIAAAQRKNKREGWCFLLSSILGGVAVAPFSGVVLRFLSWVVLVLPPLRWCCLLLPPCGWCCFCRLLLLGGGDDIKNITTVDKMRMEIPQVERGKASSTLLHLLHPLGWCSSFRVVLFSPFLLWEGGEEVGEPYV